ncbi:hypothetical protein PQY67_13170, partial [Pseudomonadales bacterium]|nr:hypothetical protein [Pseudomonadales bacterium]
NRANACSKIQFIFVNETAAQCNFRSEELEDGIDEEHGSTEITGRGSGDNFVRSDCGWVKHVTNCK